MVSKDKSLTLATGNDQVLFQPTYCLQGSMIGRDDKNGPQGNGVNEDVSFTLNTTDRHAVAYRYQNEQSGIVEDTVTATMWSQSATTDERSVPAYIIQTYRVRRLTPVECLRLQGFPDTWLDLSGASDSAKYKAVGNSIAVPCPDFIFRRMMEVLRA